MEDFLKNIAVNVVGGLIVALVLEWLRARWQRQALMREYAPRQTGPATVVAAIPRPPLQIGRIIGRMVLSVMLGFFLGAAMAGFYEAAVPGSNIELGSPLSGVFIAVGTAIAWLILSMFSRRRTKA
ncbi:MAG TPA: hypothetical protein VMF58_18600 [Rhizomicrobium sp.]|nr:hypothetical protein [Rhizomicrobium sp.]